MIPVLLIDDDTELCALLGQSLAGEAMRLDAAYDGAAGLTQALEGRHEIVLLDVNLPKLTGFEVLRELRREGGPPVVMLTARDGELDRVLGLEMGADDYLPKPFSTRELAARIRAVLRRGSRDWRPRFAPLESCGVRLDPGLRQVWRDGQEITTTAAEFDLLELLLRRAGEVVSREEVAREVLGRPHIPLDRNVDMHVCNLRRKLGHAPDGLDYVRTVRGAGYLFRRGL